MGTCPLPALLLQHLHVTLAEAASQGSSSRCQWHVAHLSLAFRRGQSGCGGAGGGLEVLEMLERFWRGLGSGGVSEVVERFQRCQSGFRHVGREFGGLGEGLRTLDRFWRCWRGFEGAEGFWRCQRHFGGIGRVWRCWRGRFWRWCCAWGVHMAIHQHIPVKGWHLLCACSAVSCMFPSWRGLYQPAWPRNGVPTQQEGLRGVSGTEAAGSVLCCGEDMGLLNRNLLVEPRD